MYSILVASLNNNMKLANILKDQLTTLAIESQVINLLELNLVMYSSKEEDKGIPPLVLKLVETLKTSKGYIVIAPEYNYSIPPVLTNTVAWISRVGDDFKACFIKKPILIGTHSGGGGKDVLRDMRNQFSKLGATVNKEEILTTYKKPLDNAISIDILKDFVKK